MIFKAFNSVCQPKLGHSTASGRYHYVATIEVVAMYVHRQSIQKDNAHAVEINDGKREVLNDIHHTLMLSTDSFQ